MKTRRTAACVAFTVAALVAATGCGTQSAQKTAQKAVKAVDRADAAMAALMKASDRTTALGSARVRTTTDLGNGTPIVMNGTYSWGHGIAFDAEMDTRAANMQMVNHAATTHVLFVGGVYYYDVDPLPSGPYKGKDWIKVDSSAVFGDKGAQAFSGDAGSPSATMRGLKYASGVRDLGTETVDGQRTTHYHAVVDQAHLGQYKDAYGKGSPLSRATGSTTVVMDIWVGSGDLPVRLKEKLGTMTVTMDLSRFGKTATVTPPPASRTADLTEAIKKQQKQKQQQSL